MLWMARAAGQSPRRRTTASARRPRLNGTNREKGDGEAAFADAVRRAVIGSNPQIITYAILKGVDAALFADELNRLGRRKAELDRELQARRDETTPALLHPRLAQMYRRKVERLRKAFESDAGPSEAEEIIRSLIESIIVKPEDGILRVEIKGDLGTMLMLASETQKIPKADAFEVQQVKLVAGTGFGRCRTRFRLASLELLGLRHQNDAAGDSDREG